MPKSATRELTVASYNIHKGVGADRRRDLDRTMAVISELGADILALQEADTRFGTREGLLDLAALRADLGLVRVPLRDAGPAHGWHGNVLLVRDALVQEVHQMALPGLEPRGAVLTDLTIGGQNLRVVAAHLGLLPGSRAAQTRALLEKLDSLDSRATLLMGDMNMWRGTGCAALTELERLFTAMPPVRSFPARYPLLPLDRLMTCNRASLHGLAAHDSPLARRASDHLPIKARLRLMPAAEG